MLVQVLSCRDNMSQSGMVARHAGTVIGADLYLPNMATQEFLSCLSKQAMESTASANRVAPRNTGKETRAALIEHVGAGSFVHPAALFPPTTRELEARRSPASLIDGEDEPDGSGDEDPEAELQVAGEDEGSAEVAGLDLEAGEADEAGEGDMPPPGLGDAVEHRAAA